MAESQAEAIEEARSFAKLDEDIRQQAREYLEVRDETFLAESGWKQRHMIELLVQFTHGQLGRTGYG